MKLQRILLIGGGHTNALVLKRLITRPLPYKISLVSSSGILAYTGMLPGFIAGHYAEQDIIIDLAGLCERAGVEFIKADVTGVQPRSVQTKVGDISYDVAALNIGMVSVLPNDVEENRSLPLKTTVGFITKWRRIYPQLRPNVRLAVVGGGAASVEVALALAWRLRSLPVRLVLIAGSSLLPHYASGLVARARAALIRARIELRENLWVTRFRQQIIYARCRAYTQKTDELPADYVFWCVYGQPAAWLRRSPMACDNKGFIRINEYLQSISHPYIFAAGDIASWPGLEKAGVFAVRQAPVLSENLMRFIGAKPLVPYKPQQQFLTLLSLGTKTALGQRGRCYYAGSWVWYWKNYLDRRFIKILRG